MPDMDMKTPDQAQNAVDINTERRRLRPPAPGSLAATLQNIDDAFKPMLTRLRNLEPHG